MHLLVIEDERARGERLSGKALPLGGAGGLTFDTHSRTAAVNGQTLTLTRKETGILEYLIVHQGSPVCQEELMGGEEE